MYQTFVLDMLFLLSSYGC